MLPRQAQGAADFWIYPGAVVCDVTRKMVVQPTSSKTVPGFGCAGLLGSSFQRRLLETLDNGIGGYLAGGIEREDACEAIADLLVGGQ